MAPSADADLERGVTSFATPEEEWAALLSGTHPHLKLPSPLRFLPSSPRCRLCRAPFRGPGGIVLRRYGFSPWPKQPNICGRCFQSLELSSKACPSSDDGGFAGAEIEISMLFADVRGSSRIARSMPVLEFTRLMKRFYATASEVLFARDAIVEKFVGDEVVALFVPMLTGPDHARAAIDAAHALLRATGHGEEAEPWLPLGAAVHTGPAFVGIVSSNERASEFTALGDSMNMAAHLAAQAAAGEILVTDRAAEAGGVGVGDLERRHLSLKGHPADALVLHADLERPDVEPSDRPGA